MEKDLIQFYLCLQTLKWVKSLLLGLQMIWGEDKSELEDWHGFQMLNGRIGIELMHDLGQKEDWGRSGR